MVPARAGSRLISVVAAVIWAAAYTTLPVASDRPAHRRFGDANGPPLTFSSGFTSDAVLENSNPQIYGLVDGGYTSTAKVTVTVSGVGPTGAAIAPYSVTAEVQAPSPPSLPGAGTCQASCLAAGHCCTGVISECSQPSCVMGCMVAERTSGLDACETQCKNISSKCEYTLGTGDNVIKFQTCFDCPKLANGTQCTSCDNTQCLDGCKYAYTGGSPGTWKAALKPAAPGGSYTISVGCTGCGSGAPALVLERVTYGQVYLCSGQSNMDLSSMYTFSNPEEIAKAKQGAYGNVRLFMFGDMGTKYEEDAPAWATTSGTIGSASDSGGTWGNMSLAVSNSSGTPTLFQSFSATCLYFALELTEQLGPSAPPIGLIQTAIGGSQIEAWMPADALSRCANESLNTDGQAPPSRLFNGMIAPFANTTVTGFLWYQGENNCGGTMGNSMTGVGYGCELVEMVKEWRSIFNAPDASFGLVTLAAGGSEGNGENMAGMRWSQTANFGTLPAPNLPNSYLAQAYDLGDPMDNLHPPCFNQTSWNTSVCIWPPASAWNDAVRPLAPAVWQNAAPSFMGGIHPRFKREVGRRLAVAAYNLLHGGTAAHTGPTIAGCSVTGDSVTVQFNVSLLRSDEILVQPFNTNVSEWGMQDSNAMAVCIGVASQQPNCISDPSLWVPAAVVAGKTGSTVTAVPTPTVSKMGAILAVKYGWPIGKEGGDSCCPQKTVTEGHQPCIPGSCPILTKASSLPANPFFALVTAGKCRCMSPQVCDQ